MSQKILLVDDDRNIALSLCVRLKSEGYEVECAYDGVSATSLAMNKNPDLVLLDISMPAGNGLAVLERLQQNPSTISTPVLIMTASRKPGLRERALKAGARAFIEKPFDTEELLLAIENALNTNNAM